MLQAANAAFWNMRPYSLLLVWSTPQLSLMKGSKTTDFDRSLYMEKL